MYDDDSDSGSDGFELTSDADYASGFTTTRGPPATVLPEYKLNTSTQNPSTSTTGFIPSYSLIEPGSSRVSQPIGQPIGRARAWRRNVNASESSEVPVQVRQNLQRQNLSTSLDFQNSAHRSVGRGTPRSG